MKLHMWPYAPHFKTMILIYFANVSFVSYYFSSFYPLQQQFMQNRDIFNVSIHSLTKTWFNSKIIKYVSWQCCPYIVVECKNNIAFNGVNKLLYFIDICPYINEFNLLSMLGLGVRCYYIFLYDVHYVITLLYPLSNFIYLQISQEKEKPFFKTGHTIYFKCSRSFSNCCFLLFSAVRSTENMDLA